MRKEMFLFLETNKKVVSLLLLFCLFLVIVPMLNVFAQDETPMVGISNTEGYVGTILPVSVAIQNPRDIAGFQFDLIFDPAKLEAVLIADSDNPDIFVPKIDAGNLRGSISSNLASPGVIKVSAGGSQSITAAQAILCQIFFKPQTEGEIHMEITNLQLSNSYGEIVPSTVSSNGYITVLVNKTALTDAISNAFTLIGSKTVGAEIGNIPQAAHDAFEAAIDAAVLVNNDITAAQSAVNSQVELLDAAAAVFNNSVITEGRFSLSNLQITQPSTTELKATVDITRISGSQNAVVVFQLKDSSGAAVGIKTADITLPDGTENISVLFPGMSGTGYTVKAMVLDKLTNAADDAGHSLAAPLQ